MLFVDLVLKGFIIMLGNIQMNQKDDKNMAHYK